MREQHRAIWVPHRQDLRTCDLPTSRRAAGRDQQDRGCDTSALNGTRSSIQCPDYMTNSATLPSGGRQVVFMTSFATRRSVPKSVLVKSHGLSRPRRQSSTSDQFPFRSTGLEPWCGLDAMNSDVRTSGSQQIICRSLEILVGHTLATRGCCHSCARMVQRPSAVLDRCCFRAGGHSRCLWRHRVALWGFAKDSPHQPWDVGRYAKPLRHRDEGVCHRLHMAPTASRSPIWWWKVSAVFSDPRNRTPAT